MSYPPEDTYSSDDSERWDAGAPLNSEQTDNISNALTLYIPDASFSLLPVDKFKEKCDFAKGTAEQKTWDTILDKYKQGELPQRKMHTVLGRTPQVLQECGAANLPIKIGESTLYKITEESHKVPIKELRRLLTEISHPIAVFESANGADSIVVLTKMIDTKSNLNSLVVIHLGIKEDRSPKRRMNKVASVYGKKLSGIETLIRNRKTRYVNKQKSHELERSNQLQLLAEALNHGKILTEEDVAEDGVFIRNYVKGNLGEKFQKFRWIKQDNKVFGWFDPSTGETVLREGCTAATIMEAIWHITLLCTKTNYPKFYDKMLAYAQNATQEIKDIVSQHYPEFEDDPNANLEKIGAVLFSKDYSRKLKRVLKGANSLSVNIPHHKPKERAVDIDELMEKTTKEAMASLANAFVRGKFLGWISPYNPER